MSESVLVLGVDYGEVRIGLALGDLGSGLVLALPVLEHPGDEEGAAERLAEVARIREVGHVVLGNPIHMSGAASPMSLAVARIRDLIADRLDLPVPFHHHHG